MTLLELFLSVVDLVVGMFSQVVFGLGYIIVAFLSSIGKVAAYFVAVVPALSIVVGIVPTPV